jgi:hypothetical protein
MYNADRSHKHLIQTMRYKNRCLCFTPSLLCLTLVIIFFFYFHYEVKRKHLSQTPAESSGEREVVVGDGITGSFVTMHYCTLS